mmetsp:Transcript_84442/g.225631  ORF Transcript_84442/g.225631 Transcript_84442/m.225631 type:complete len:216 (-) Transcript_84442:51-698(-)
MAQRLHHRYPLLRVEPQHGLHHAETVGVGVRIHVFKPFPPGGITLAQESSSAAGGRQPGQLLLRRSAPDFHDFSNLIQMVLAREKGAAPNHLTQDTPYRPDIDGLAVAVIQDDFRRSVPPGHHIISQSQVLLIVRKPSCKSKITNLQVTVLVHQDVRGLQIPVNHVGRVQVLQPAKDLVDEILEMLVAERLLGIDHPVQVGLHKVGDNVDILKIR